MSLRPRFKLADLLEGESERQSEVDWGEPQGNEVW